MAIFNGVFDNTPIGGLLGTGSPIDSFFNPTSWWDNFKNGRTNEVNQEIANQNLQYQRERNVIEDERYRDETLYNRNFSEEEQAYQRQFAQEERDYQRKFAEDERAYNRALQQKLFEREDTALERQAASLSSMGINPLSQQLNGLGAGQAVTSSLPSSLSAGIGSPGSMSSRGGSALHNDFNMQDTGALNALAPLASLANTINQVATGQGQRDLLRAQADKQQLDNYIQARQYGLQPDFMNGYGKFKVSDSSGNMWFNMNGINQFNKNRLDNQNWSINDLRRQDIKRELDFRKNNGIYTSAPNFLNNMNIFSSDSFMETAEKCLTKGADLYDKALKSTLKSNDKKKMNPFTSFLNLFF